MGDAIGCSGLDVPSWETAYYAVMPEQIDEERKRRDEGWDAFKKSGGREGMGELTVSAQNLALLIPDYGDLLCGGEHGRENFQYARELFASSSRLAVALAINRSWGTALDWARAADDVFMPDNSPAEPTVVADQYEVIFDGQLALVLAGGNRLDRVAAKKRSQSAAKNCIASEDPDRVFFPNREMGKEERNGTVNKFSRVAKVANGLTAVPAPAFAKREVAQRVLARSLDS